MDNTSDANDFDFAEFADLESVIRSAGEYVVPSDELRPRTMDAVKDAIENRKLSRRAGVLGLAALSLWLACWPLAGLTKSWRDEITAPSKADMERTAAELSLQSNMSLDWGLVEAFEKLRSLKPNR